MAFAADMTLLDLSEMLGVPSGALRHKEISS